MPGPKAKVLTPKVCPACQMEFFHRRDKVVCCSKTCARSYDARRFGPSNWKGGVNRHAAGYLKQLAKGHPAADKNGYVMQHRLVMETVLGRFLGRNERVHHKNGVRDDNRPENLELWNVEHKDPPGVRTLDQVYNLATKLSAEDRKALIKVLQEFE